jgi:transposase
VAPSTVRLTLKRLASAGLSWPLPAELTDATLEAQLFTEVGTKQGHRRRAEPDWGEIHRELKRKHVTLQVLWDEYIERHPDGYRYSRLCELYRGWASRISVTMRQTHAGGDKLFVDYAGDTVPVIIDRLTGKTRPAQIFVAALGASNFTYAEASRTQALADWIGAHTRAFEAIGGVPNLLVPDNTKVAVIKACLYEPQVNRTYAEMAAHYDTAIRDWLGPARVAVVPLGRVQFAAADASGRRDPLGRGKLHRDPPRPHQPGLCRRLRLWQNPRRQSWMPSADAGSACDTCPLRVAGADPGASSGLHRLAEL